MTPKTRMAESAQQPNQAAILIRLTLEAIINANDKLVELYLSKMPLEHLDAFDSATLLERFLGTAADAQQSSVVPIIMNAFASVAPGETQKVDFYASLYLQNFISIPTLRFIANTKPDVTFMDVIDDLLEVNPYEKLITACSRALAVYGPQSRDVYESIVQDAIARNNDVIEAFMKELLLETNPYAPIPSWVKNFFALNLEELYANQQQGQQTEGEQAEGEQAEGEQAEGETNQTALEKETYSPVEAIIESAAEEVRQPTVATEPGLTGEENQTTSDGATTGYTDGSAEGDTGYLVSEDAVDADEDRYSSERITEAIASGRSVVREPVNEGNEGAGLDLSILNIKIPLDLAPGVTPDDTNLPDTSDIQPPPYQPPVGAETLPPTEELVNLIIEAYKNSEYVIEDVEQLRTTIRAVLSIASFVDKMALIQPVLDVQNLAAGQYDILLFRLYGPANPFYNSELFDLEFGGPRMLIDSDFDVDPDTGDVEDWFVGYCEQCRFRIRRRWHAVRMPRPMGGWSGCYCSFKCVRDAITAEEDSTGKPQIAMRVMADSVEEQLNSYGIQDRLE